MVFVGSYEEKHSMGASPDVSSPINSTVSLWGQTRFGRGHVQNMCATARVESQRPAGREVKPSTQ